MIRNPINTKSHPREMFNGLEKLHGTGHNLLPFEYKGKMVNCTISNF